MADLVPMPSKAERNEVAEVLETVAEQHYDEIVLLGFKDGRSYLHHSKIESTPFIIGAIEWLKHRLMEK